jgi:broad specificity phosphatase PhoE
MKELYIIRHGETELNRLGIVQGRGVDADLNDTGRTQGKAFYTQYKHINFDKIYTSTLKRTHQTVKGFIDQGLPWEQLAGLDELAWGIWEGKTSTEESLRVFKAVAEEWQSGNYDEKFEGGESPNEVLLRLQEAMSYIISKTDEHKVLICMHGRAMRLLLCHLANKPLSEMADFPHQNTTLYKVTFDENRFSIVEANNTNHFIHLTNSSE